MTLSVTEKVIRGETLTKGELASFIGGYLSGGVSRDDMTAFLRAVCARGLSEASTIALTEAMLESGDRMSFTPRGFPYADRCFSYRTKVRKNRYICTIAKPSPDADRPRRT